MTTLPRKRNHRDLIDELKKLDFISSFFSWIFLLMSRLAEPCMLLSAIYIIIEAGIPQAANTTIHNLSVGAMITAPEIILPGAFVLAARARKEGKASKPLFSTCICFVILTLTTLLSLFVFHFAQDIINVFMFLRCATGISYSILIRISSHSQPQKPTPQPGTIPQLPTALPELTQEHIHTIVEQLRNHAKQVATETIENYLQTMPKEPAKPAASAQEETAKTEIPEPTHRPARPTTSTRRTRRSHHATITPIGRKLVTDDEVREAYKQLAQESPNGRVTADSLKIRAGIGKPRACQWLRDNTGQAEKRLAEEGA